MKLFTDEEYKNKSTSDLLPLKCEYCGTIFYLTKRQLQRNSSKGTPKYCCKKCCNMSQSNKISFCCCNCGKNASVIKSAYEKHKNHFCSKSCAATYNNTHKTKGTRRSKLEIYLEQK